MIVDYNTMPKMKGHDTFSNALKELCKQSKERAYYTIVEEMAEKDDEAMIENSENTKSTDEYSASSVPQWVQGTWAHNLTAPMVGTVASYKFVVSGNTMAFYRNGEMQYRDNYTYQNGHLVGQHDSFVLKENLQRLADRTGTFNKEGGSGSNKLDGVQFSTAYDVIGYLSEQTFREESSGGSL
jgi:predicted CopG family antitoxin